MTVKTLSLTQITDILEGGNFDLLKGITEDEILECKSAPYQLDQNNQKLELAKDISALANASGGIILLGARTEKNQIRPLGDTIQEISPIKQDLVNPDTYIDVMKAWIYPRPEDVRLRWFESLAVKGRGLWAIFVPMQAKAKQPFLITKTPDDTGKKRTILFGLAQRRRSSAEPISIEEIHSLLKDGELYGSLNEKLTTIHEELQDLKAGKTTVQTVSPTELLDGRVGLVLSELDLGPSSPTYVLTVSPIEAVEIPSLFEGKDSPIVKLLDHPPELRNGGFDLDVGENSRIIAGERRRSLVKKYKSLNLWRDGTFIYAAEGEYLCWGMPKDRNLIINQLSLIESIYLFVTVSSEIYGLSKPRPKKLVYQVQIRNMTVNGINPGLIPNSLTKLVWPSDAVLGPSGTKVIDAQWHENEIKVGEIAFKLAREFYAWFGLDQDKIPYSEKSGGVRIISDAEIRRLSAF